MYYKKNIKISREEALKYLFSESSIVFCLLSGATSAAFVYFLIVNFLYFARFIDNYLVVIITTVIFLIFGIIQSLVKKQEFLLYDKTFSDIFLYDIISLPLVILLFSGVFIFLFIPQWQLSQAQDTLTSMIITIFALSFMISFVYITLWKILTLGLLGLLSKKDWYIMAEKDYFLGILALRFEESKRYGVPLSIVGIKINLPKGKNYKKYLYQLYNRISKAIREIDTIAHYGEIDFFYILAPIPNLGAKGLVNRIIKIIKEFFIAYGLKINVTIEASISSLLPETQTEFDLLNPQQIIKEEINLVSNNL